MAEWHWYCDQHGQIDRSVELDQQAGKTVGRCSSCGSRAVWTQRDTAPGASSGEQLALFGDRL